MLTAIHNVTNSTGIHVFHITGICPKLICLQHCTHISCCTSTVVYIQTPHYYTHPSKINILQYLFMTLLQICAKNQYVPLMSSLFYAQITQYISMGEVCQFIYHI